MRTGLVLVVAALTFAGCGETTTGKSTRDASPSPTAAATPTTTSPYPDMKTAKCRDWNALSSTHKSGFASNIIEVTSPDGVTVADVVVYLNRVCPERPSEGLAVITGTGLAMMEKMN